MWVGVIFIVVVEFVLNIICLLVVVGYLFIISIIGGNVLFFVLFLKEIISLRIVLYIFYFGLYFFSFVFFFLILFLLKCDMRWVKEEEEVIKLLLFEIFIEYGGKILW